MTAPLNCHGWRVDGITKPEHRRTGCEATRQAVRYTPAEDAMLIAQFEAGSDIDDMAVFHQRSANGIGIRLARLGMLAGDPPPGNRIDGFTVAQAAMRKAFH